MSVFPEEEELKPSMAKKQRRREKSRDAARHRRTKETVYFQEIANLLPVSHDLVSNLDRSSIMRLVNSYIRLRQSLTGKCEAYVDPNTLPIKDLSVKQEILEDEHLLASEDFVNALNGFLFILSPDSDILYCSENVKDYLGLSKLDLIGQSILSFVHEGDHEEIRGCLNESDVTESSTHKAFFLRMKSTLTVNGKSINLKSASYKVLQCSGFRKVVKDDNNSNLLVVQAEPIPHPSNIEHFLDSQTFLTQHTPDMKFSYCDDRVTELLGYDESDMLGKSFFNYCHVLDIKPLEDFFHKLYRLNQIETTHYRFLSKTGGYHWIVTQATVIPCSKNQKPQCVVCVHYVLSGPVNENVVFSTEQHQCVGAMPFNMVPIESSDEEEKAEIEEVSKFVLDDNNAFIDDLLKAPTETPVKENAPPSYGDFKIVPLTLTDMDENDEITLDENLIFNAPSIGDPWTYSSPEKEQLEDLFRDVAVENTAIQKPCHEGQQQQNAFVIASPPSEAQNQIDNGSSGMTRMMPLPLFDKEGPPPLPYNTHDFRRSSISPCDSAYCGSPISLPGGYQCDEGPQSQGPRSLARDIGRFQKYQTVPVRDEKFAEHKANLQRGYVGNLTNADLHNAYARKRNHSSNAAGKFASPTAPLLPSQKRRCLSRESQAMYNGNASQAKSRNPAQLQQFVNVLLQPGTGYGCTGEKRDGRNEPLRNLFLQRDIFSSTADCDSWGSNLLPELSVHDCEVNAPLLLNDSKLPLGADCVHALDEEIM
uniref:HIF hypoxia inducible factor n=1 Tax=Phallusia mammillata TaxID=59560 RepID=A0A6F9DFC7_9ASCI|nr:HIF hypoxia inducible factor [Phallusia mammillata]